MKNKALLKNFLRKRGIEKKKIFFREVSMSGDGQLLFTERSVHDKEGKEVSSVSIITDGEVERHGETIAGIEYACKYQNIAISNMSYIVSIEKDATGIVEVIIITEENADGEKIVNELSDHL